MGLQPLSRHSVLIMKTHLQTISLGGAGEEKNVIKKIPACTGSGELDNITADHVRTIGFESSCQSSRFRK